MGNLQTILNHLIRVEGTLAAALIDGNTAKVIGKTGSAEGLDMAAAINTSMLRSKLHGVKRLEIQEQLEDLLITSTVHYHVVTFIADQPGFFLYTVLQRDIANLGAARYAAKIAQQELMLGSPQLMA